LGLQRMRHDKNSGFEESDDKFPNCDDEELMNQHSPSLHSLVDEQFNHNSLSPIALPDSLTQQALLPSTPLSDNRGDILNYPKARRKAITTSRLDSDCSTGRENPTVNANDSIETANSMSPQRSRHDPFNVSLRDDYHFCLDPLRVYRPPRWVTTFHKRSKANHKGKKKNSRNKKHCAENVDSHNANNLSRQVAGMSLIEEPFKRFGTRTSERLEVVSEWLNSRDSLGQQFEISEIENGEDNNKPPSSKARAVIVSVVIQQIISLVLYMMLQNVLQKRPQKSRSSGSQRLSDEKRKRPVWGYTLIIGRTKEDLKEWECVLRERTLFSVLNHAEMSSTERRHSKTALKCAGFDVVLTTFDAIKAKEAATSVNEQGRVLFRTESQGGWLASRSCDGDTKPKRCEVLSILHGMAWHRLLFVDVLGKQSYLTKPATTKRCMAASALHGNSRIIFFLQSSNQSAFNEDKLKESRRQLMSLARVLDFPEDKAVDAVVGEAMLDLRDVVESKHQERIENSYCAQSSISSGDYISESETFS